VNYDNLFRLSQIYVLKISFNCIAFSFDLVLKIVKAPIEMTLGIGVVFQTGTKQSNTQCSDIGCCVEFDLTKVLTNEPNKHRLVVV
jgi:hypothetical protein